MDLNQYPTPTAQVAARIVEGQAVIVLADSGEVNVLNEVGTRVWELADGTRRVQDLVDTIVSEYDVTIEIAQQDVEELLKTLMAAGAIALEPQPVSKSTTSLSPKEEE